MIAAIAALALSPFHNNWLMDYELTRDAGEKQITFTHYVGLGKTDERYVYEWREKGRKPGSYVLTHDGANYLFADNPPKGTSEVSRGKGIYDKLLASIKDEKFVKFDRDRTVPIQFKTIAGINCVKVEVFTKDASVDLKFREVYWYPEEAKLRARIGWLQHTTTVSDEGGPEEPWEDVVTTKVRLGAL